MSVMISKRRNRVQIDDREGYRVLDLGHIEIWDGADLALIRDMMVETIEKGATHVGVDMTYVKYIPSGFFGMMFDWLEQGIPVRLYTPQPNVANMLWFRQFFLLASEGVYDMVAEPKAELVPEPEAAAAKGHQSPSPTTADSWASESVKALAGAHLVAARS